MCYNEAKEELDLNQYLCSFMVRVVNIVHIYSDVPIYLSIYLYYED